MAAIIDEGKLGFVTWLQQMLQQQGKPSFKSLISQIGSNAISADSFWHTKRISKTKGYDLTQKYLSLPKSFFRALPS